MFLSKIIGLSAQAPCRRPLPGVFLVTALTAPSSVPPLTISLLFKQSRFPSLWVRNSSSAHTAPPLHVTAAEAFPPSGRGAPASRQSCPRRTRSRTRGFPGAATCRCTSRPREQKGRMDLGAGLPFRRVLAGPWPQPACASQKCQVDQVWSQVCTPGCDHHAAVSSLRDQPVIPQCTISLLRHLLSTLSSVSTSASPGAAYPLTSPPSFLQTLVGWDSGPRCSTLQNPASGALPL